MPSKANAALTVSFSNHWPRKSDGALREEVGDEPLILERQLEHAARPSAAPLISSEQAAAGVGRRLEHEIAQHVGRAFERRVVGRQALGVARRELARWPRWRAGEAVGHQQRAVLVDGPEVGGRALDDREAVPRELEVADDLRIEQAHRVGGDRVAKAGMELLGDGRAADDVVLFEHDDGKTGRGEIGRRRQPVVAAADDRDVVAPSCARLAPSIDLLACVKASQGVLSAGRRASTCDVRQSVQAPQTQRTWR